MKTKNVIDIPEAAFEWSLEEIPITPRLRNALQNHGWRNLSSLHGQTSKQLLKIKGCGVGSVADLNRFLARFRSGELDRLAATSPKDAPGVVVQILDGFCVELSPRERDVFLTRMGGYREPLTLADIGHKYGITRERVRQVVKVRIEELRRFGGPPFSRLLRDMKDQCEAAVAPLTPELLAKWVGARQVSYRYSPSFYVRAIREIMPEFPAWPEARGVGHPSEAQLKITTEVKRLLQGASRAVSGSELFHQLKHQPEFVTLSAVEFLDALRQDMSIGLVLSGSQQLLVQPPLPEALECVRRILSESDRALTLREILDRAHHLWSEQTTGISLSRLTRALRPEDGVFLLGSDTYGLRKHIRLPEAEWAKVREDVHDLLQKEGWSISTFEMVHQPNLTWTREVSPYELAAILQDDARFAYLGRCLFTIAIPRHTRPVGMSQFTTPSPA